jgi:peptidoglycan/xylan/chitin deacetylase (PgdA/CDA1 family)
MLGLALKALDVFNKIKCNGSPLPILYFHRVLEAPDLFCPDDWTIDAFEKMLRKLNKFFTILSLEDAMTQLSNGTLASNALCITFDDGYMDNAELAAPIFNQLGIKANFFVASQGTERGYLWNDMLACTLKNTTKPSLTFNNRVFSLSSIEQKANAYLTLVGLIKVKPNEERDSAIIDITHQLGEITPNRCMMTKEHLLTLQEQGHTIGAHTVSHSILSYQNDQAAMQEIQQSVAELNAFLPKAVRFFAFPNGWYGRDFSKKHEQMLSNCNVEFGLASNDGGVTLQTRPTCLPRFMPHRKEINQFCISIKKIAGERFSA